MNDQDQNVIVSEIVTFEQAMRKIEFLQNKIGDLQGENRNLLQELFEPDSPEGKAYRSEVSRLQDMIEIQKNVDAKKIAESIVKGAIDRLLENFQPLLKVIASEFECESQNCMECSVCTLCTPGKAVTDKIAMLENTVDMLEAVAMNNEA